MTISEIIRQGLHYTRTCKSLWLFGFFVGIWSGGSGGASGGGDNSSGGGGTGAGAADVVGALAPYASWIAIVMAAILLVAVAAVVLRFVSEGALIEGIVRSRQGGKMTTREGFRAGWAHWGVLVRIAIVYFAATMGSLALLAAPALIAVRAIGWAGGVAVGVPAVLIAVPWLVTLYLVQAFASRIAVIENRRALDAIAKARLFLHGRLMHGLRLIVASFAGTLAIVFTGLAAMVPVVLLLVALVPVLRLLPVIVLGCAVLVPALSVLAAVVGTFRSSIWTIGYVTQAES